MTQEVKYPGDGNFRSVSWAPGCVLPSGVLQSVSLLLRQATTSPYQVAHQGTDLGHELNLSSLWFCFVHCKMSIIVPASERGCKDFQGRPVKNGEQCLAYSMYSINTTYYKIWGEWKLEFKLKEFIAEVVYLPRKLWYLEPNMLTRWPKEIIHSLNTYLSNVCWVRGEETQSCPILLELAVY